MRLLRRKVYHKPGAAASPVLAAGGGAVVAAVMRQPRAAAPARLSILDMKIPVIAGAYVIKVNGDLRKVQRRAEGICLGVKFHKTPL